MSRRTYLTSYFKDDGRKWAGPDLEADSREEAEAKAERTGIPGLVVLGPLVESIEVDGLVVGRA